MTSGQRVAFSLLLSILVFCAFSIIAFSGLFDLLEVNFYQPVVREIKEKKLKEIANAQNEYLEILIKRFNSFVIDEDVKSYIETRAEDFSAQKREKLRSELVTSTPCLSGIRIVDDNGRNIYFSSFQSDIIANKKGIVYRNYDTTGEAGFDSVKSSDWLPQSANAEEKCRLIKDGEKNRLIFSLPFYDKTGNFRATALFYCDAGDFAHYLYDRNLIDMNGFCVLVTENRDSNNFISGFGGYVFGLPNFGKQSASEKILQKWHEKENKDFWKIAPESENENLSSEVYCVFSEKLARDDFGYIAAVYKESELRFSKYIRILILATSFITLFLAFFLIFSFKHDDIVVIRDKIQRYESEFLAAYKKLDELQSPEYFETQRKIVEKRIIKSLGKKVKKYGEEIQILFNSSWNEMLSSIGVEKQVLPEAEQLKQIVKSSLEDIIGNGKLQINAVTQNSPAVTADTSRINKTEEIPEADEIEEAEPEEISELTEIDEPEELSDIEEIDEADEVEELSEIEEIPEVDEIEENSESEEIEEPEELSDIDEISEVEEAENLEELSDIEEIDDAENVEEISEPEELPDADEIEEISEPEEYDELEEISEAEEIQENPETEDLDKIDSVEFLTDTELTALDEEGLSREPTIAEQYDIMRLKDSANKIADDDEIIEELDYEEANDNSEEENDTEDSPEEGVKNVGISPDDEIYKDERLLEKIEFGVPSIENDNENAVNPLIESFKVDFLDYSFLDEDSALENMYNDSEGQSDNSEHFYENPYLTEETTELIAENADDVQELENISELESVSELEVLETPEENMPFSFTQIASANNVITDLNEEIPDSIIQNSDGTFQIAENPGFKSTAPLDLEFKKLVDSVLR
ncbi:hypothetical protein [Treponema sp.]|uniref:hypothetical protein n=1 Tax=Treponema sp. TaxID=166 RepID=UPI0038905ABC